MYELKRAILSLHETFRWELVVPYDFPLVVLHTIISFHSWCMLEGDGVYLNEEQPILVH